MGTISWLAAAAVCAALLGLATSHFVGSHLSELLPSTEEASTAEREQGGTPASALPVAERVRDSGQPELAPAQSRQLLVAVRARGNGRPAPHARGGSRAGSTADSLAEALARGITKVGERRYVIKRSAVDLALANLMSLSRFGRASLELREGKPFGFRLSAIAVDGPFAKLGLRDGDILVSINGLALTSPDQVLEAYGKLRTARHFELRLMRAGREVSQEYVVRS